MHRNSKKRKLESSSYLDHHQPVSKRRRLNSDLEEDNNINNNKMKTSSRSSMKSSSRRKKNIKKMTIKKFRVQPKLSTTYEKDTVNKLMNALNDIHLKRGGQCSFEELYRSCQSLCTLNKGKLIYDKLYECCDKHIETMIDMILDNNNNKDISLLYGLKQIWDNHRSEMHAIRQVFLMLDRTYVRQETEIKSLWKMGIILLKKHILQNKKNKYIEKNAIINLLKLIELERNGEEIDKQLIKTIIIMIAHLNIYKTSFEKELIIKTNEYYLKEGNKLIETLIIPDYLNSVMKKLNDEHERCIQYLDNKTQRYLSIAIEQQMINKHVEKILEKGFNQMCDQILINDLRHLYALFKSVNKLQPLKEYFHQYSKTKGLEIVNFGVKNNTNNNNNNNNQLNVTRNKEDKEMIPKLLAFKKKLDTIISQSFQRNGDFRKIIRKSWEYFINQRQNKPAELMAKVWFIFFFGIIYPCT